jgi:dihydroorotase
MSTPLAPQTIMLRGLCDAHVHLRDGAALAHTVAYSAMHFEHAVIMPNLNPPLCSTSQVLDYAKRVEAVSPQGFLPHFTLYGTSTTSADEVARVADCPQIIGIKIYPHAVTTGSAHGVTDIRALEPLFEAAIRHRVPILLHAEDPDPSLNPKDRERVFVQRHMDWLLGFEGLRLVIEHVSTAEMVCAIRSAPQCMGATVTAHHLWHGERFPPRDPDPHLHCAPPLQQERDRTALLMAAIEDGHFFLGTDSAPHSLASKLQTKPPAGIFSAPVALPIYAMLFDEYGHLDALEAFAVRRAQRFYELSSSKEKEVMLLREPFCVPASYPYGSAVVVPLAAGRTLPWRVKA